MAVTNVYDIHEVFHKTTRIDQISQSSIDPGVSMMLERADGVVDTVYAAVAKIAPRFTFSTSKVATVLTSLGINGTAIDTNFDMYFKKRTLGGTHAASGHVKCTLANGLIIPTSVSAGQDSLATVTYNVIAVSADGTTSPINISTTTVPAGSATFAEGFVAGPVTINGSAYSGITGIEIDFGVETEELSADGEVYDTFTSLVGRQVNITVSSNNVLLYDTIDAGVAQGVTASTFYLRKVQEDGTRVANATAEHLKFTVTDGYIRPDSVSVSSGSAAEFSFVMHCTWDGTNDAVQIAAAAIS